jgi:hypothetical protein
MDAEYRVDFLRKGDVIVECKAVTVLTSTHRAQLFNYMRLLKMPCGIIVNFYPKFATIERYFYDTDNREILTSDGKPFLERQISAGELARAPKKSCFR